MTWRALASAVVALLAVPVSAVGRPWTVGPDGAGAFKVGMSMARLDAVSGENLQAPERALSADPTGQCFYVTPSAHPALHLMILRGQLARIDVVAPGVATDKGIEVGASVDAVMRAYGRRLKSAPNAYDADERDLTLYPHSRRRGFRFETQKGRVSAYYAGTAEAIGFIEGCS